MVRAEQSSAAPRALGEPTETYPRS